MNTLTPARAGTVTVAPQRETQIMSNSRSLDNQIGELQEKLQQLCNVRLTPVLLPPIPTDKAPPANMSAIAVQAPHAETLDIYVSRVRDMVNLVTATMERLEV